MRQITTIIACLWLTACEPYEPPGEGGTESSEPNKPTPPQNPPGNPPSKPGADENGCFPNEDTCSCGVHFFEFSEPLPAPLQFPNPLGAMDMQGNYFKGKLACTSPKMPADVSLDLSDVPPFFVSPSFKVGGFPGGSPIDTDMVAQFLQDDFACLPISSDAGSAAWKRVTTRAVSKAVDQCAEVLENVGCASGVGPVLGGQKTVGVGAEDVCLNFMGYHLKKYMENNTLKLKYSGIQQGLIYTDTSTCATSPVDESCDFGGSTG